MLDHLLRFSLKQRLFVLVTTAIVMGLGFRSWLTIPIDAFPEISPAQVKIILKAPGMTAEEIERRVTQPIETELLGVPHQTILRSTTKYAIADITLDFEEGTDLYWARQQVTERLSAVRERLPANVSGGLAPMSTPLSEMLMFTLENDSLSLLEKRDILDWQVRPVLRTVPGVADINVLGGRARTYAIAPDLGLMSTLGITQEQIGLAIAASINPVGAGRINQGNDVLIVRSEAVIDDADSIGSVMLSGSDGRSYALRDLAEISTGELPRYGAVTKDGEQTAQAIVVALRGSNTGELATNITRKLQEIETRLPEGSQLNVFYDRSRLIDTAVATLSNALFQAVILVIAVLAFFLGNLRAALIVSFSLPCAALATFLLMGGMGVTANLMSLGGLVVAIGMIVDSSVVVTESILSRLSSKTGLPVLHDVFRASSGVAAPVVSGTLVILIVFAPLLTLEGLEGKLFSPMAITIVFAMVSALLIALTVVPVLAAIFLRSSGASTPRLVLYLQEAYRHSLTRALDRPRRLAAIAMSLLLLGALLTTELGKTFMPVMDEGDIIVQLEKTPSITLQASIELDQQISDAIKAAIPEVRQVVARTGSDELGLDPMGLNETDVFMELAPRSEWRSGGKTEIEAAIRDVLSGFPGINVSFTQPIQMRTSEMLTGSTGDIALKIFGDDLGRIAELTVDLATLAGGITGAADVVSSVSRGGQYLAIHPKTEIAQRFGIDTVTLGERLQIQLEGLILGELVEGQRRTPIQLLASPASSGMQPASIPGLMQRMVMLPDGSTASLADIADFRETEGFILIEREQGRRFGMVSVNVEGRDVVGVVNDIEAAISEADLLPQGYSLTVGGDFENQARATRTLLITVPFAMGLIVIILLSTLGSLRRAALIIGNIPPALVGGVLALAVSGEYLSVPASVGLIALLGVSVLNGIVMLVQLDARRSGSKPSSEAIVDGAVSRLRPVLMTAVTAVLGLVPLVFASGPGAEIQKPLAIVVIGGLVTATLATLYLLPVAYYRMERHRAA